MRRKLSLFDFDGTMIKGDSIARLVRFMFLSGRMTVRELCASIFGMIKWKLHIMPVNVVKTRALCPLNRMTKEEAERFLKRFVMEKLVPRLYQDAVKAMKGHLVNDDLVLLVSASPLCYLKYLKDILPVSDIIATRTDEAYRVTNNVVGEEKNRQILSWLSEKQIEADFEASFAYGDSSNDLSMLSMTGHPHLCNPHANARKKAPQIPVIFWH